MIHLGTATRVCFVKFKDPSSVHVAQHLTNTVFIDRALIVVPVSDGEFNLELGKFLWRGGVEGRGWEGSSFCCCCY